MNYLLKPEWMKVKKYPTFRILFTLFIISMVGINNVHFKILITQPLRFRYLDS
jgi:hypothetical protein